MLGSFERKNASIVMSERTPLTYFLPMKTPEGMCGIALASVLGRLQNDFIEQSWKKLEFKAM